MLITTCLCTFVFVYIPELKILFISVIYILEVSIFLSAIFLLIARLSTLLSAFFMSISIFKLFTLSFLFTIFVLGVVYSFVCCAYAYIWIVKFFICICYIYAYIWLICSFIMVCYTYTVSSAFFYIIFFANINTYFRKTKSRLVRQNN